MSESNKPEHRAKGPAEKSARIDWELPWTLEGFSEVLAIQTPASEKPARSMFPGWPHMYHATKFINQKYEPSKAMAYGFRFFWGLRFLLSEMHRFRDDGLLIEDEENIAFSNGLLYAVAVLPFSDRRPDRDGQMEGFFLYDDVAETARRYNAEGPP